MAKSSFMAPILEPKTAKNGTTEAQKSPTLTKKLNFGSLVLSTMFRSTQKIDKSPENGRQGTPQIAQAGPISAILKKKLQCDRSFFFKIVLPPQWEHHFQKTAVVGQNSKKGALWAAVDARID